MRNYEVSTIERFTFSYECEPESQCWLWIGARTSRGYACLSVKGKTTLAHRWAYEQFIGPIPEGLTLDHLCRVRHCVNPKHLEPVTRGENVLRGDTLPAANRRKTHCARGHEYAGANVYPVGNGRRCVQCNRDDAREYQRRKRAERRAP